MTARVPALAAVAGGAAAPGRRRAGLPGLAAAALLLAAAAAGAAQACSINPHSPSSVAERGEACSVTWRPNEIRSVGLLPATDLGRGYLMQVAADGNGCYAEAYAVVMDCAAGQALVVGPHMVDIETAEPDKTPFARVTARIEDAAKAGQPMPLDAVEAAAAEAGLTTRFRLRVLDRLNLNGRRIALTCGCKTFYPGFGRGS